MPASFLQVPPDAGGKKVRSRRRVIGSDTVEEQYLIAALHDRVATTRLFAHSGALVVGAAADAANVGRLLLINHVASASLVCLRAVHFKSQLGSALAAPTSPRFVLRFFTFASAPSGAQITMGEQDTAYPAKAADWSLRTANTGLTITEGADLASFFPIASATAVAYTAPAESIWPSNNWEYPLILRAGEGVMLKQADAGTTSDTRRVTCDLVIDEYTVP